MPASLLPQKKVEQLLRQGLTPTQVAQRLLDEDGIKVTRQAISNYKIRHGVGDMHQVRHSDLLPWVVRVEHKDLYPAIMLRYESRQRGNGDPLTANQEQRLNRWKETLDEQDAVVHYDGDTEQGFFLVARRPGVDTDLVRDPNTED